MNYDLMTELRTKNMQLDQSLKLLRKSGEEYAKSLADYRMAFSQELLKLRDEGYAISLAENIARGKREIATLKQKQIIAEAVYEANRESINVLKLQIKLLNEQISREWVNAERNS